MNKNTSAVVGDASEAVNGDSPQPSLGVLLTAHDTSIAQVDSPPQESSEPDEEVRELTQVDEGNLRERGQATSAPFLIKGRLSRSTIAKVMIMVKLIPQTFQQNNRI